jgi:pimeloyl-ACP methyl ester carboxylesterase
MQEKTLAFRNSLISYRRSGEGPELLLCFHGYGEKATAFDFLAKYTGNQYTVYAIELPFHGHTQWKEGLLFTGTDLLGILDLLLSKKQPFTLMGFSLGGRVALSLYQLIPERIPKMVLLAPDGLKVNGWYWLATQTRLGNRFFAFTMRKPGWFLWILHLMKRLRMINTSIYKFVDYYIGSKEIRNDLYTRWTAFRRLKPDLKKLRQQIKEHQTIVRLVYGRHDRIILSSTGEKFRKGIEPYCSLEVIASGHQVLHEKHAADIVKELIR